MDVWLWIAAYVLGMLAVQALLYRYRRRHREHQPSAVGQTQPFDGVTSEYEPDARPPADGRDADADADDGRRCPHCGTVNEADNAFSYCRNCIAPLGG